MRNGQNKSFRILNLSGDESCKKTDECAPVKQPTYYIGGGRGSGKSTFLRALIHRLTDPENKTGERVENLTTIDPTTLGSGENFFIYILSCFYEKIKSKYDSYEPWEKQSRDTLKSRAQLSKLMEDLTISVKKLTNPKTSHLETIDDSWVYQDSMKLGISSKHLMKDFNKLVQQTCELLGCGALIIGIDDADINCSKSIDVLEYLRKYMITSRLIFVFAGDMNLQEQVVRGMQLANFNQDSFRHDSEHNQIRIGLIDQMQEQYLLKLFPISNRYTLPNLQREELSKMDLMTNNSEKPTECITFLENNIKNYIGDKSSYQTAIINMPKRTFFQLLKYWMTHQKDETERDSSVAKGLQQIANYSLSKYGIRANKIEQSSVSALSEAVISAVSKDVDMISAASLIPVRNDELNRLFLYLSAEIHRTARDVCKGLEFLLSTYSYFQAYNRFADEYKDLDTQETRDLFTRYADSLFTGDYVLWGRRMTATMAYIAPSGAGRVKQFRNGCIRVMKKGRGKEWLGLERVANEIIGLCENSEESKESSEESQKDMLRYYLAFHNAISGVSLNNTSALCISVYNILGCMQQCISLLCGKAENGNPRENSSNDEPTNTLIKIISPKSEYLSETSPFSTKAPAIKGSATKDNDADGTNTKDTDADETNTKDTDADETDLNTLSSESATPTNKSGNNDLESIATEIIKWWDAHSDTKAKDCYAPAFSLCWKQFTSSLAWRADDIVLSVPSSFDKNNTKNNRNEPYHYVAETLDCYMKAFTDALRDNLGEDYANFVESFPLWEPLSPKVEDNQESVRCQKYEKAREWLNRLYAGQAFLTGGNQSEKPRK